MTKISELIIRQGNVNIEGTIKEIGEIKTFNKFGRELRVADAILEDDSGIVKLTLWNDDVTRFKSGDKVKIINGYVNEFQGEKQLTAGKFGQMEKLGEGEGGEASSDEGRAELSEEVAETIAEDAAEDKSVKEAVKEEAPEGISNEKVESASETLEEAADEPSAEETSEEKIQESADDF